MIRILVYIASIVAAAWIITGLTNLVGFTVVELEGQRLDISTNVLIGLLIIAALFFFFGGSLTNWLAGLPKRLRRRREDRQRVRGMIALTRGLEAVAAGDAADAQRLAKTASKTLQEPALTRLLTAQAAQLAGDRDTAEETYAAMLEAPETEFLGLRGLYMQALESGDRDAARAHAERAFELRPGTSWAFESVLSLSLERGAWGDALEAISLARQNASADGPEYRRMEGALLTAQAFSAQDSGDDAQALKDSEAALKKASTLTPAAALAAEAEMKAGRRSKAAKILADAWEAEPHPGLAEVMRRIFSHERDERVRNRLVKLTERAPDHPESKLLLAQIQLDGGDAEAAQLTLEPLLSGRPRRRILELMAAITEARYGAAAAAVWHAKANAAPAEMIPGADGVFHYTTEGWRRLIREYGDYERLAPPPLEVEAPELPADEVKALLMPPPEPEDSDETAAEGGEAGTQDEEPAAEETSASGSQESSENEQDESEPLAKSA